MSDSACGKHTKWNKTLWSEYNLSEKWTKHIPPFISASETKSFSARTFKPNVMQMRHSPKSQGGTLLPRSSRF